MPLPPSRGQNSGRLAPVALTMAIASVAALAAGCGDGARPGTAAEARSTASRITAPSVPASDAAELATDNRAFAVDLHQVLRTQPGNLVYSPASISIAIAML